MAAVFGDEHVNPALLAALQIRGVDVDSVHQRGLTGLTDAEIIELALRERRFLLTTDADFLVIAHARQSRQEPFAPILWWPQADRTIGQLLSRIMPVLHDGAYDACCSRVIFV